MLEPGEPTPIISPSVPDDVTPTPVDVPPMSAAGGMSGEPAEPLGPSEPPCESVNLTIDELRPAVTLLVDQSGSMREGYPLEESELTRWQLVRQALLDPTTGVLQGLQHSIQFGLTFYTSHNGFSSGACPVLTEVRTATNNYEAIRTLYDNSWPEDDTPTGAALAQVARQISASARKGPELILLVTDGDPDTCLQPDPQGGQAEAIAGTRAAYAAGIPVYVLGISSDISGDKLQQLANAGQGKPIEAVWGVDPDAAEPFQASASVVGFTTQLREILAHLPLCEVELERDVKLGELAPGNVLLDGEPLLHGSPDGFQLKDSRHLQIVGKACETLRAAGKRLSVRISCD